MLSTSDSSIPTLLKSSPSIQSVNKVLMEWNHNSFYQRINTGCYLTTYSSTYDPTNADKAYDDASSYQFFESGGETTVTNTSTTSNSSTVRITNSTGITVGMRVSGESIPVDTYVSAITTVAGTVADITISKNTSGVIPSGTNMSFSSYKVVKDIEREKLTPASSMFLSNRPDPGIVNLVSYKKGSEIIPVENLKIGNFGDIYGQDRKDRVYPIAESSSFKYWNSIRNIKSLNIISTVGISDSSSAITHAAPFTVYEDSFYVNKITVKTQKYDGNYPVSFKVEYLPHGSNTWTTALSLTNSAELSDGILNIYYNGSSWSTTKYASNKFTTIDTNTIKMRGIRFSITKMSAARIPAEVIEISPRLVLDVSDYASSFKYSKALSNSSYGMPVS